MDGTSARGQKSFQQFLDNAGAGVRAGADLNAFHVDLLAWLNRELPEFEVLAVLADPASNRLAFENLRSTSGAPGISAAWLKSHLERHPSLIHKLSQGELVGISSSEASSTPRPAENARASIVLVPVLHEANLRAVLGILAWLDGPQPSTEQLETMRTCAIQAAPSLDRIIELEQLRRENAGLRNQVLELAAAQEDAAEDAKRGAQLRAMAQIHSHLHSNVTHELRTPLAAVRGYARMMLDGRSGEVTDRQREYLNIVVENANKMIHLVNWIGDVFEASEQGMELAEVDLKELWTEHVQNRESEFLNASVNLTQDIPNASFVAFVDRDRISHAFNELLTAAVLFSEPGSDVTATFSHGRDREIAVKLSGISREIPPENATRERRRQSRVDVDLASVYDSIGIHGGRFFVRRTADEGTVLLLTLPAIRSEGSAQP